MTTPTHDPALKQIRAAAAIGADCPLCGQRAITFRHGRGNNCSAFARDSRFALERAARDAAEKLRLSRAYEAALDREERHSDQGDE